MRVLLTNDDGIYAPGLWAQAEKLIPFSETIIVAPDREKSGIGTAVTLHRPLRANRVRPLAGEIETYAVEGTPADCVILALEALCKNKKIDLIVSGINEGSNLGHDVFISGTVGAALHGFFHGIPSIALSIASLKNLHMEVASSLGAILVSEGLLKNRALLPENFLLNINLPNLPADKIKGIEITRIGRRSYTETVKEEGDGRRRHFWIQRGQEVSEIEDGTDIMAIKNNRISLTPIFSDFFSGTSSSYLVALCNEIKKGLNLNY